MSLAAAQTAAQIPDTIGSNERSVVPIWQAGELVEAEATALFLPWQAERTHAEPIQLKMPSALDNEDGACDTIISPERTARGSFRLNAAMASEGVFLGQVQSTKTGLIDGVASVLHEVRVLEVIADSKLRVDDIVLIVGGSFDLVTEDRVACVRDHESTWLSVGRRVLLVGTHHQTSSVPALVTPDATTMFVEREDGSVAAPTTYASTPGNLRVLLRRARRAWGLSDSNTESKQENPESESLTDPLEMLEMLEADLKNRPPFDRCALGYAARGVGSPLTDLYLIVRYDPQITPANRTRYNAGLAAAVTAWNRCGSTTAPVDRDKPVLRVVQSPGDVPIDGPPSGIVNIAIHPSDPRPSSPICGGRCGCAMFETNGHLDTGYLTGGTIIMNEVDGRGVSCRSSITAPGTLWAHEIGHILGLDDSYVKTDPTTPPLPGCANRIMASLSGRVTPADCAALDRQYNTDSEDAEDLTDCLDPDPREDREKPGPGSGGDSRCLPSVLRQCTDTEITYCTQVDEDGKCVNEIARGPSQPDLKAQFEKSDDMDCEFIVEYVCSPTGRTRGAPLGPLVGILGLDDDGKVGAFASYAKGIEKYYFFYDHRLYQPSSVDYNQQSPTCTGCGPASGLRFALPTNLTPGNHTITLVVMGRGDQLLARADHEFSVAPGSQARLLIEIPAHNPSVETQLAFSGWAASSAGIDWSGARVEIDGQLAGGRLKTWRTRTSRPEVCATQALADPSCPKVGFDGLIDVQGLSLGTHHLSVIARDQRGREARHTRSFRVKTAVASILKGYIDGPRGAVQNQVNVSGWAIGSRGVQSVTFTINGQPASISGYRYGTDRADVCAHPVNQNVNDPNCPRVGFRATLDTAGLAHGEYQLTATLRDDSGGQFATSSHIHINNPQGTPDTTPPDAYVRAIGTVSGTATVTAWALDSSGVSYAQASVDGSTVGVSRQRLDLWRSDVCAHEVNEGINDPRCPRVGAQVEVDTTRYSNGTHTFRWAFRDPAGNQTVVERTIVIANP